MDRDSRRHTPLEREVAEISVLLTAVRIDKMTFSFVVRIDSVVVPRPFFPRVSFFGLLLLLLFSHY